MPTLDELEKDKFFKELAEAFPKASQLIRMYTFLSEHRDVVSCEAKEMLELIVDCGYHLRCLAAGLAIVASNAAKIAKLLSADLEGGSEKGE